VIGRVQVYQEISTYVNSSESMLRVSVFLVNMKVSTIDIACLFCHGMPLNKSWSQNKKTVILHFDMDCDETVFHQSPTGMSRSSHTEYWI